MGRQLTRENEWPALPVNSLAWSAVSSYSRTVSVTSTRMLSPLIRSAAAVYWLDCPGRRARRFSVTAGQVQGFPSILRDGHRGPGFDRRAADGRWPAGVRPRPSFTSGRVISLGGWRSGSDSSKARRWRIACPKDRIIFSYTIAASGSIIRPCPGVVSPLPGEPGSA